ncbi:hypothetical protein, partial [Streptomyces sp. NPDC001076]
VQDVRVPGDPLAAQRPPQEPGVGLRGVHAPGAQQRSGRSESAVTVPSSAGHLRRLRAQGPATRL